MHYVNECLYKERNARMFVWVCLLLTHDLSDSDGLVERGGRAAASDVDSHDSEQHLLPHRETLHFVLVLLH